MATDSSLRTPVFDGEADRYHHILQVLEAYAVDERDATAMLANTAAVLWQYLPDISWVGFYVFKAPDLVVGPFQGKPACIRIALGKGVCGTAAAERRTIIVPDVNAFDGHIACDSESRSEIVVPMFIRGQLVAVLDVDSKTFNRFSEEDAAFLERVAALVSHACEWPTQ